jgi:DNA-binding protein HU-beta
VSGHSHAWTARQGRCLVWFDGWWPPARARKSLAGWSKNLDPVGPLIDSESYFMASRPAPAKKAPVKKPAAKGPALAAPKSKAVAAPVVTLKTVFEQLGETHALPKKQANALLADFVAAVTMHLGQGARIRMSGLGTLEVKKRAERMGRNPATGEQIKIKASKKVAFRAAKELKEAV